MVEKKAISEWKEQYFQNIKFPILIIDSKDFIVVSDLEEYYIDADINIFGVNQESELIDSEGKFFKFKKINNQQWTPDTQVDEMDFQDLKERIVSLLCNENHEENIDSVDNVEAMIDLLLYGKSV